MHCAFTNQILVVREYRCAEDDGELPCEDQDMSDMEIIQSDDVESMDSSTTLATAKRRRWGLALLGAVQNAVPKRHKEEKQPYFTRRSFSLSLRLGHHPPGLKIEESGESTKWQGVGDNRGKELETL